MTLTLGSRGPSGLLRLVAVGEPKEGSHLTQSMGSAWKYRIGSLDLKQFRAQLADETYKPAVAYDIDAISVAVENIDNSVEEPVVFNAKLQVNDKGLINGSGTAQQDFKQVSVSLEANVPLEPLRWAVALHAAASLAAGRLIAATQLNYHAGATPEITAAGSASIQDFRLNETDTNERLIAWKALLAQKFNLSLGPNRHSIKEIHLHEPALKVAIDEDMNVNLAQVVKNNPGVKETPKGQPGEVLPETAGRNQKDILFPAKIA